MREIKFRAWDNTGKKMYMLSLQHVSMFSNSNYYEIMQYTGLKDCKGQEIYEGDIVRINHPQDLTGDFTNAIGEVFWWEEEGGWYHGNNNGRPPKRMWEYVEIIGNIYEHSHLLNAEGNTA